MGLQAEIVVPRYVVMTRLVDSWIPRALHADPDNAEAEAFRWRRIYGPRRTRIAEYWVQEAPALPHPEGLPAPLSIPLRIDGRHLRPHRVGGDHRPRRHAALVDSDGDRTPSHRR